MYTYITLKEVHGGSTLDGVEMFPMSYYSKVAM